jgi:hypothetical protein
MKRILFYLLTASLMLNACKKHKPRAPLGDDIVTTPPPVADGSVVVTKDAIEIDLPGDATGYNTKFPDEAEPWKLSNKYTPGFVLSQASVMRYPGGTVTNYWDFNNDRLFKKKDVAPFPSGGWVSEEDVNEGVANAVISKGTQEVNSVEDLKNVVSQSGCSVMFVMNMTTPGWDYYQVENPSWPTPVAGDLSNNSTWKKILDDRYSRFKSMLNRAVANNIPINYIELGNELYFFSKYYTQAFPNGNDYATAANYIAGKIKADFPQLSNLKISAIASAESTSNANGRVSNWNNEAVPKFDRSKIHSVSMHSYYDSEQPNNFSESTFHTSILDWISLAQSYISINHTQAMVYDKKWPVWYTEVFANDTQTKNWGQNLLNVYTALYLYQNCNNYIYLQSRFDEQVKDPTTLKPRSASFVPYMQAAKKATKTSRLNFDTGGTIGSSTLKVLQGYMFQQADDTKKALVINLSSVSKTINLQSSSLFSSEAVTLSGKVSTLNDVDTPNDISDTTYPSNKITIRPYSINYIRQ